MPSPLTAILVGTDHSARSDFALQRASQLALRDKASVIVEYALDIGSAERMREPLQQSAIEEIQERAHRVLGEMSEPVEARASPGRPFEVLSRSAVDAGADLIVIGARRSESRFFGAGSTAVRLAAVAPVPVLIVGEKAARDEKDVRDYERVLVAFDGSQSAKQALLFARRVAPSAEILVVTAYSLPPHVGPMAPKLADEFEKNARRIMADTLAGTLGRPDLRVEQISRFGKPLPVIAAAAEEFKPDLLVTGASKSELQRYVFGGGVADRLASEPPCDLLIVRS